MDPQSPDVRTLVDNNHYGQFRLPIWGTETVAVRSINPTSRPTLVEMSLSQVTVYGPLPAIRERLSTMIELLDRVAAEPEHWDDIKMTRVGPGRWKRLRPHPFIDRSMARDPTVASAEPAAATRPGIMPFRRRAKRRG